MHAYLIAGKNDNLVGDRVSKLVSELKITRLDFPLQKIADLKELRKFVSLSLAEKTAVVIDSIDTASIDAQNAFLKSLEEPQENLVYILTAKSEDSVLSTIASRCQIIEIEGKALEITNEKREKVEVFLKMSVGQKLAITSKIVKREDAKDFLQELLSVGHTLISEKPEIALQLDGALKALDAINKNGNVQIQLTNLVVSMAS